MSSVDMVRCGVVSHGDATSCGRHDGPAAILDSTRMAEEGAELTAVQSAQGWRQPVPALKQHGVDGFGSSRPGGRRPNSSMKIWMTRRGRVLNGNDWRLMMGPPL